ncbi:MAG: EAL domain-containing protein, partial [Gammaproteobacteria bacterium]|nr:EAL domain-containing protein [Gammaproteobacteria bacterium]
AKLRGRNRVEVHYVGGGRGAADGHRAGGVWPLIAESFAGESLELLAQPVLPLGAAPADPRFEVLLRMRAPDGARLGYEKWAQADSDPALARRIDLWVLDQVLSRLDGCRETLRQHPASFSVNLTAASLGDAEFWRMLESTLRVARIEPGVLGFEFPEAAVDGRVTRIAAPMRRLRDLGVPFALDNFGRDPASLSNLNALPVSSVKIDGCLGRSLLRDPHSQSLFIAITKLAQGFGLDAIATSIETDAIRARAVALGADFGQGFFIGKPVALDEALRDLSLYSCFSTSTGLFDFGPGRTGAKAG